jgi:glycosyltransferase involved in cell wall biosynthesis
VVENKPKTLKLVPSLTARRLPDGRFVLTRKFLEGVKELQRFWAGPVAVYMQNSSAQTGNLDDVSISTTEAEFSLEVLSIPEIARAIVSDDSAVVLLSLDDFRQTQMWSTCRDHNVTCFYVSEYSLTTRLQIIKETTANPLKRLRRRFWENGQERKRLAAVAGATGVQCNGTPTYNSYKTHSNNALLYFDSRVTRNLLATDLDIEERLLNFGSRPIRLFFSGRLARIKGAMHLLEVAKELRRLNVDFELTICGDGELKNAMLRAIESDRLHHQVKLQGVLDFETQLLPYVRSSVDLFLCCHPQGDPACTYLETMSCGVPIAGYENEAFAGVVQSSGSGWLSPLNRPGALASMVADIYRSPDSIRSMSFKALRFAESHTFEKTFCSRIEHLRSGLAHNTGIGASHGDPSCA